MWTLRYCALSSSCAIQKGSTDCKHGSLAPYELCNLTSDVGSAEVVSLESSVCSASATALRRAVGLNLLDCIALTVANKEFECMSVYEGYAKLATQLSKLVSQLGIAQCTRR